MGIVGKFSLETLKEPKVSMTFRCPYCKSTEISVTHDQMINQWEPVKCKKCGSKVFIDALSVTVIRD